jgi:hypothetical protein
MSGDKTSGDIKTGDITSVGQNVRRDIHLRRKAIKNFNVLLFFL